MTGESGEATEFVNSRVSLSEFFSMVPPPGWDVHVAFDGLPVRLLAYGKVLYQPPTPADVYLKWQITNWLEDQEEWETFDALISREREPTEDDLQRLYALLLRISVENVSEYGITVQVGLGPCLIMDYLLERFNYKGRIMYIPSPTGICDVQILSYEGGEPGFSTHLIDALMCMESCRQTRPHKLPLSFVLPRPNLSIM